MPSETARLPRRAKIICTVGPSTDTYEAIFDMVAAGMDVARLNFSHGTRDQHAARAEKIRRASREAGRAVAILQDLQGPKIRVETALGRPIELAKGTHCIFTTEDPSEGETPEIRVSYPAFAQDVSPGDEVLLDDGMLRLSVTRVEAGGRVHAQVVHGGLLKHRKGLNLPGRALSIDVISDKDRADLKTGIELGFDFVALSFVQHAEDVRRLKRMIKALGGDMHVIAKIEKPQAVDDLDAIMAASDGIMIARGDLGVEMPTEALPPLQKRIIAACNRVGRPVITATQMLESMVVNPQPTRAEATDVANAVFDGTDAVMLSAETASGAHPLAALETMARIVSLAEQSMERATPVQKDDGISAHVLPFPDAISYSSCHAAKLVGARAIVALSIMGNIPRALSRYRPEASIVALSTREITARRMCLLWGVQCYVIEDFYLNMDEAMHRLKGLLLSHAAVQIGDVIILTAGVPFADKVPTNALAIETV